MTKNSKIGLPEKPSPTLILAQVALDRIKLGYQDQPSWNELRRHVEDLAYALNESEASEDILLAERDRLLKAILHFISCDRLAYQPINNVEDARKLEHLPDDSVSVTDFIEALTGIPRAALSGDAKDE